MMAVKKDNSGIYVKEKIIGVGSIKQDITISELIDILISKNVIKIEDLNVLQVK